MKTKLAGLVVGISVLGLSAFVRAEDALSLIAQADSAYSKRADVAQSKIAMVTYERAAAADPGHAVECGWKASRAAWWVGDHTTERGERLELFKRGMDNAQKAVVLDPNSVEAHFWLGANQGSYGDTKGVMKSLSLVKPIRHEMAEVIRLNDRYNNGAAYHVLGVVDYKVPGLMGGNKTRAKEELEKALAIGPNDPFNHYYLADYYKTMGNKEKLQSELEILRTLQVTPDLVPELSMLQQKADRELK